MIARALRRAVDVAQAIRALPEIVHLEAELDAEDAARHEELERRMATLEQDVVELGQEVADLDAITRELYVGGDEQPPAAAGPQLCDFCRDHPGQTGCTDPTCLTNAKTGGRRDAS